MSSTPEPTGHHASVQINGVARKIHYHDLGAGEPVVMLHGAGPGASGWSNFSRNVDPLVAAGHRVVLVDAPGWHRSDPIVIDSGFRTDANAAAVIGVLDHLGIDRANIVGNSMGGATALAIALDHPERLARMIVMGGAGLGPSLFVPPPPEGIRAIMALYKAPTFENLRRMLDIFVFDPGHLPEALARERYDSMMAFPQHIENFVDSQRRNPRQFPDYSARLGAIAARTLVVWGRDDRFIPLDHALKLVAGLQDAELHVFSKCGHWAQWEHAERFNRLALDFLAEAR